MVNVQELIANRLKIKQLLRPSQEKCLNLEEAIDFFAICRILGISTILTEGTWDLTHAGHVQHNESAMQYADLLLLRLASKAYVQLTKGITRPYEDHREFVVPAFEHVDAVWVDDTSIPYTDIVRNAQILRALNPHKLALELGDEKYPEKLATTQYANEFLGANIIPIIMNLPQITSTTAIATKIKNS